MVNQPPLLDLVQYLFTFKYTQVLKKFGSEDRFVIFANYIFQLSLAAVLSVRFATSDLQNWNWNHKPQTKRPKHEPIEAFYAGAKERAIHMNVEWDGRRMEWGGCRERKSRRVKEQLSAWAGITLRPDDNFLKRNANLLGNFDTPLPINSPHFPTQSLCRRRRSWGKNHRAGFFRISTIKSNTLVLLARSGALGVVVSFRLLWCPLAALPLFA